MPTALYDGREDRTDFEDLGALCRLALAEAATIIPLGDRAYWRTFANRLR